MIEIGFGWVSYFEMYVIVPEMCVLLRKFFFPMAVASLDRFIVHMVHVHM